MFQTIKFPVTEWFSHLPLYQPVDFGSSSTGAVKAILTYTGKLDFYCPECQKISTFEGILSTDTQNSMASEIMATKSFGFASGFWTQLVFSKQLACTRAGHLASFYFQIAHNKLYKVGQHPSIADIHMGEMLPYLPALGENRIRTLQKAIALEADSAGLAAFMYLKQLFESLLEDLHQIALKAQLPDWDETRFQTAGTIERISQLSAYMPSYIIENSMRYAILDAPLLALNDDFCLVQIPTLKNAVYFLIDRAAAEYQYQLRLESTHLSDKQ